MISISKHLDAIEDIRERMGSAEPSDVKLLLDVLDTALERLGYNTPAQNNVIDLNHGGYVTDSAVIDEDIVACLRKNLELAESGKIVSLAIAYALDDGCSGFELQGDYATMAMVGNAEVMRSTIVKNFMAEDDDEWEVV